VGPPTRSAIKTPVLGGETRLKSTDLALTAIFAALYAVLVIALAPISFGPVQLRVADCLIPLAALFGWPVVLGVSVGCFIGNVYYWLGVYDVVLGPIANLIAAAIIFFLRKKPFLACVLGSLPIGFIVGGYLWLFFPPPEVLAFLPVWAAMVTSLTVSSFIAVAGVGYAILKVLKKREVFGL